MDIKEFLLVKDKNINRHPWELARLKMLSLFIRQCGAFQGIADIGSGDAFLAGEIAKQYPQSAVLAIDINYTPELIKELSHTKPENLIFCNDTGSISTTTKIDIVILMDVLEHLENPGLLLQEIARLPAVSPGTFFIITVPAYQRLFSQHDKNLGHYRRYHLKALERLLTALSFKISKSGYCFNSLILFRFFGLLKEKINGNRKKDLNSIHNWKGSRWVTSFVTNLFWIEFKISWYLARIGIKLPGLSCYMICQPYPL